jgi:histidyl-tRNA synthetase
VRGTRDDTGELLGAEVFADSIVAKFVAELQNRSDRAKPARLLPQLLKESVSRVIQWAWDAMREGKDSVGRDVAQVWEAIGERLKAVEWEFLQSVRGISAELATQLLDMASTTGEPSEILDSVMQRFGQNAKCAEGIRRLRELLAVAKTAGVPKDRIKIDLSICRGRDYYTGTIYETFLSDLPGIGSVCSGGRYDNLASKYTKQVLPGVGASLGLDRLVAAMEELKHPLITGQTTPAQVLVVNFDATRLGDYQRIARKLRADGVNVEVYPDATKKVGQQFGYAEKRGFKLAVIAGPAEFEQGVWKVKDLAKREEVAVPEGQLMESVRTSLNLSR